MSHPGQVLGPDTWADIVWRVSSYSANVGGSCVEAGALPGTTRWVAVRHSHHPDGLTLVVGQPTWATFLDSVKNDELA